MLDFLVGNEPLSGLLAFVLVLIPAVLVHELGHFLAAKAVGITILEFGIGFPPRLAKLFTYKGTDYTLNWLPLGGFVRPLGEDIVRQVETEEVSEDRAEAIARGVQNPKSVSEARPGQRIFFMAAGAGANFLFALIILTIVALIGIPQTIGGVVLAVEPGNILADAGIQDQDVILRADDQVFADAASLIAYLYERQGQDVTLTVQRPNPDNPIEEPESIQIVVALPEGEQPEIATHPLVGNIAPGSPAETSGLETGDAVLRFNDQDITSIEQLQAITRENLDQEVTITVWRGGETLDVTLVPRSNPPAGEGAMGIEIGDASIDLTSGLVFREFEQRELRPQTLPAALQYSFGWIVDVFETIIRLPADVISGLARPEDLRPVSVLGISQVGSVFLQRSIERDQPTLILEFVALINVAIGLTNLLPIPALDGGRILFVLIEIIRGRPVAPRLESTVHLIGLALLLSLTVVVVLSEIADPITNMIP